MGAEMGVGSSSPIPVPRSIRVAEMLWLMLRKGEVLARDLAEAVGILSKHVYCYLKPWIKRGVVEVRKTLDGRNRYAISDCIRKAVEHGLGLLYAKLRGKVVERKVVEVMLRLANEVMVARFGRELNDVERAVVEVLARWWWRKHRANPRDEGYLEAPEGLSNALRNLIQNMVGKQLDPEEITRALIALRAANIVYWYEYGKYGPRIRISDTVIYDTKQILNLS